MVVNEAEPNSFYAPPYGCARELKGAPYLQTSAGALSKLDLVFCAFAVPTSSTVTKEEEDSLSQRFALSTCPKWTWTQPD